VQPVAFKATEEKKDESTPSRLPIDASKLDNEEMTLIIKSFRQILKQRKGKNYKPLSKRVCYRCGKSSHFIAKCPYSSDSDRDEDKKGKKKMEKKTPPTSPSKRDFSSPTSATSVSWLRTVRGRRYILEIPLNTLHLMMRVALVIMMMI
jgi:hypothetical protein